MVLLPFTGEINRDVIVACPELESMGTAGNVYICNIEQPEVAPLAFFENGFILSMEHNKFLSVYYNPQVQLDRFVKQRGAVLRLVIKGTFLAHQIQYRYNFQFEFQLIHPQRASTIYRILVLIIKQCSKSRIQADEVCLL